MGLLSIINDPISCFLEAGTYVWILFIFLVSAGLYILQSAVCLCSFSFLFFFFFFWIKLVIKATGPDWSPS